MLRSLHTTVSIPAKCPGRTAPSRMSPAGPGTIVVRGPSGYMSSTVGANTNSTPAERNSSMSSSKVRGYASRSSLSPNCSGLTKIDTMTTTLPTLLAASINCKWPAWSAPIVGTNATRLPARRNA
ncbi:Uncharacterised protein [Mycobacteroides abscessus subsp. abscessus]|nr:Uncharacterised protein [Mycobacteroides abscessus subsp. abscessus]